MCDGDWSDITCSILPTFLGQHLHSKQANNYKLEGPIYQCCHFITLLIVPYHASLAVLNGLAQFSTVQLEERLFTLQTKPC